MITPVLPCGPALHQFKLYCNAAVSVILFLSVQQAGRTHRVITRIYQAPELLNSILWYTFRMLVHFYCPSPL